MPCKVRRVDGPGSSEEKGPCFKSGEFSLLSQQQLLTHVCDGDGYVCLMWVGTTILYVVMVTVTGLFSPSTVAHAVGLMPAVSTWV